jgi:hypothetical protein
MRRHGRIRNSHEELRMSTASEENPTNNPLDALDALIAATRRPGERAEPRLAAVSDTPFPRVTKPEPRPEPKSDLKPELKPEPVRPAPMSGDRLENAMSEFVRRQVRPQIVPPPVEFVQEGKRRTLLAAVIGVGAAVVLASVVALLFVSIFPRDHERDAIQSFAAAVPAAPPPQTRDTPNGPAQIRGLVPVGGDPTNLSHEQSERLLQQFVQWRQKTASTDKP